MNRRGGYPLGVGLDRRRVLAAGLAAVGTGASFSTPLPCQAAPAALRKLAAEKGLLYGTTISAAQISGDHEFVDLVLQQAGLVVPENDMKWQDMNRGALGEDNYGPADTVAAFALENGLALRGTTSYGTTAPRAGFST